MKIPKNMNHVLAIGYKNIGEMLKSQNFELETSFGRFDEGLTFRNLLEDAERRMKWAESQGVSDRRIILLPSILAAYPLKPSNYGENDHRHFLYLNWGNK